MKIMLVCDCCDVVFKEINIPDDAGMTDLEALTGEEFRDIILQNDSGSHVFVSATCNDCSEELGYTGNDFDFRTEPIIH